MKKHNQVVCCFTVKSKQHVATNYIFIVFYSYYTKPSNHTLWYCVKIKFFSIEAVLQANKPSGEKSY